MSDQQKRSWSNRLRTYNEDYRFRDDLNNDEKSTCPIELMPSGLVVRFAEVTLGEKEEPSLDFKYDVIDNPNDIEIDSEIVTQMGDVLVTFINQHMEKSENESGTDNIETPT